MIDRVTSAVGVTAVALLLMAACGGDAGRGETEGGAEALSGRVEIDGSSTVYLVSEAVAEEFTIATGGQVRVTVGSSGTGGGFKRFCTGETDISDASRSIKETEEQQCVENGVEYVRFDVALDGIAVVMHPLNDFVSCLTVDELRRIWEPGSTVTRWSDINRRWPEEPFKLYGPGTNSGTFDYFTEAINGEEGASRADYTASEDDNVLVQGVEGDEYALGYFGFAYYWENRERLGAINVDGGAGCVRPSEQTIKTGEYAPLSRPLYIYVKTSSLQRPEVRRFLEFYLENAAELVPQVGYVALDAAVYQDGLARLAQAAGGD